MIASMLNERRRRSDDGLESGRHAARQKQRNKNISQSSEQNNRETVKTSREKKKKAGNSTNLIHWSENKSWHSRESTGLWREILRLQSRILYCLCSCRRPLFVSAQAALRQNTSTCLFLSLFLNTIKQQLKAVRWWKEKGCKSYSSKDDNKYE